MCFGLAGPGSECYGFDDELSRDHDFEPGFCVFYPEDKLDSRQVFALERAYAGLPAEFIGFSRNKIASYGGMRRRGVIGINEFYSRYVPGGIVPSDLIGWAEISESALCEALNGYVFEDNYGLFSSIRAVLSDMPDDIKKKRLAGLFFGLSQSGWYNVPRMLKRGENGAARLFLAEFVRDAAKCVYIVNDRFSPYMKWLLRGIRDLPAGSELTETLNSLANVSFDSGDPAEEALTCLLFDVSSKLIELCGDKYGISKRVPDEPGDMIGTLQAIAFELNGLVSDNYLRNADIMFLA
ncbi:MAG: DUF4037 domain-containing protein [Clostridia bacterium]|nr:DUF4037 domain-containing protein [Clostridia bacterium]